MNRKIYLREYVRRMDIGEAGYGQKVCKEVSRAYDSAFEAIVRDGKTLAKAYGVGGWRTSPEASPYLNIGELTASAKLARKGKGAVRISDINHNGAWLGSPARNLVFRAHHDAMHVLYNAPFTLDGEIATAVATIRTLGLQASPAGALLFSEIVGQALYFEEYGEFPTVLAWKRQPAVMVPWTKVLQTSIFAGTF